MQRLLTSLIAVGLLGAASSAMAYEGFSTGNVNLRAGPDIDYPVITVIPPGADLDIQGCTDGYEWCDVLFGDQRGWMAGNYIQYEYNDQPVLLSEYGGPIGVPVVSFVIADYWGHYYRDRPFWVEHDRWYARPYFHHAPPPPFHGEFHDWGHDHAHIIVGGHGGYVGGGHGPEFHGGGPHPGPEFHGGGHVDPGYAHPTPQVTHGGGPTPQYNHGGAPQIQHADQYHGPAVHNTPPLVHGNPQVQQVHNGPTPQLQHANPQLQQVHNGAQPQLQHSNPQMQQVHNANAGQQAHVSNGGGGGGSHGGGSSHGNGNGKDEHGH